VRSSCLLLARVVICEHVTGAGYGQLSAPGERASRFPCGARPRAHAGAGYAAARAGSRCAYRRTGCAAARAGSRCSYCRTGSQCAGSSSPRARCSANFCSCAAHPIAARARASAR
jgi:hypothetical protein